MLSHIFAKLLNLAIGEHNLIHLTPLEGRSFAIAINELPQDILITFNNGQIVPLAEANIDQIDVTISGSIKAILNMIQDDEAGLEHDDLYVAGKITTAKHFQRFLASLSIDWHGFFGKFLPDNIAEQAADAFEQSLHFAKGSIEQLGQGLQDYVIDEKKWVVTQTEFGELSAGIEVLNRRLDNALEAVESLIKQQQEK